MGDISDMSLWSLIVPGGGKECKFEVEQQVDRAQYVHITNVALPPRPEGGEHCLTLNTGAHEITVATLNKESRPQHNLDFILDQTVVFKNYGKGAVHLLGYMTTAFAPSMEDEDEMDDDDSEGESEDDSDEEAPQGVPLRGNGMAQLRALMAGKGASDSDDDDDEDEEYDGNDESDDPPGGAFPMGSDDEVMEYDEDGSDADDDSDDDESGGEDSDDDDDSDEDTPAKNAPAAAAKRPAGASATPQPVKKQKGSDGAPKVPASAPPKQQQAKAAGGDVKPAAPATEKDFEKAVKTFLQSRPGKTVPIGTLGSHVHKPPSIPKLGQWLKSKPGVFKVDANGSNVTLL